MAATQNIFTWQALDSFERNEAIALVVASLKRDQVAVLPTETRYALVANAMSEQALWRLMKIKGRTQNQPLSVFVRSTVQIGAIANETTLSAVLTERFLPGPMTLVLTPKQHFPSPVVLNDTIGIRVTTDRIMQEILSRLEFPVTATSANRSGAVECTTIDEIFAQLGSGPAFMINDGLRAERTSTIVNARGVAPVILREGAISSTEIEAAILDKGIKD